MSAQIAVFGIRHHGPGSARILRRALDAFAPAIVLIEGPPDAAPVIAFAADPAMRPPVALLVYEPDAPSRAVYYPFAVFSPEWQALQWASGRGAPARFIDLPHALKPPRQPQPPAAAGGEPPASAEPSSRDPLDALALAAGFSDGEAWWGRLIEEHHGGEDPLALFEVIREAMASAREQMGDAARDADEPAREAHMRRGIRTALKEGFARIAVVCGAWHAPVLTADALKRHPARSDEALLKGLAKRKTAATWIPWTYDRLSFESGYGAGVASPGWYDHLWQHHEQPADRWMIRVARLLRAEDLDASPANVIESVRLADALAAMRGRRHPGLEELGEATLSVLCHGNPLPARLIQRQLIVGQRLGEVPDGVPMVPLQRDLMAQQKSLRLKLSADETLLDLDQRKPNDLARSRLLHRLRLLGIAWGELHEDQRQQASTFHEIWTLAWRPEFAVAIIEAARWGNSVADAAAAAVADRVAHGSELGELTALLDDVMLADLGAAVERLLQRIQSLSAVATDVGHLMTAVPPLARVLRYGNVRRTDAALVEPVVGGLLARVAVGLLPASVSLDDDAAAVMRDRIDGVQAVLPALARPDWLAVWHDTLARLAAADVHGLLAGRASRILLDAGAAAADTVAERLSASLSRGNDPANASAWLEGFLSGSGLLLLHDERLLAIVDAWLTALPRDGFEQIAPIARRTFATFERAERRQIGEKLKRLSSAGSPAPAAEADDLDAARAAMVEPILRIILGDRWS